MNVYLMNVIRAARLFTPVMQTQGGGSFVNISTYAVFEPEAAFPTSGVFRAGLAAFTKLFCDRYAADKIRMNNVLPGFIDSLPETEARRQRIPMGRYGQATEVAELRADRLRVGLAPYYRTSRWVSKPSNRLWNLPGAVHHFASDGRLYCCTNEIQYRDRLGLRVERTPWAHVRCVFGAPHSLLCIRCFSCDHPSWAGHAHCAPRASGASGVGPMTGMDRPFWRRGGCVGYHAGPMRHSIWCVTCVRSGQSVRIFRSKYLVRNRLILHGLGWFAQTEMVS